MEGDQRRKNILKLLSRSQAPVSASVLAQEHGVSRQVIVGDIALLRAKGSDIIATTRGYAMATLAVPGRYIGKIACQHSLINTATELRTVVELGGEVLDVVVDHYLYGEITGQLNIASAEDVDAFLLRVHNHELRLLSELTGGVHLHTIACRDADAFVLITGALKERGLLYEQ